MADQKLGLLVKAKDQASAALGKVRGAVKSLDISALGLAASFAAVALVSKKVVDITSTQEKAEIKLAAALKAAGDFTDQNFRALLDVASAQQKVTTFGDEATIAAIAQLKAYSGLSTEVITRLIPSIQDFASAQEVDLKVAFELVGKSIGSSTNALARYGVEIDTSADKVSKAEQLMKALNERFGGAAQAQAGIFAGQITQLTNSLGDLFEVLGTAITQSENFSGAVNISRIAIEKLIAAIAPLRGDLKSIEELEAERADKVKLQNFLLKQEEQLEGEVNKKLIERIAILNQDIAQIDRLIERQEKQQKIQKEREREESVKKLADKEIKALEAQTEALEKEVEAEEERVNKSIELIDQIAEHNQEVREDELEQLDQFTQLAIERDNEKRDAIIANNELIKESARLTAEFQAQVVAEVALAIGASFSNALRSIFTANKDFGKMMRDLWTSLINNIINLIGQAIARALVLQALTTILPGGGALGATGFGKALGGLFGINTGIFKQTSPGMIRTLPGPSTQAVPFIGHGGEPVGRGLQGGLTLVVQGDFLDMEESRAKIFDGVNQFMKNTGASFA